MTFSLKRPIVSVMLGYNGNLNNNSDGKRMKNMVFRYFSGEIYGINMAQKNGERKLLFIFETLTGNE